ncbi:MAG: hypothetical protein QOG74_780 [Alphaproteobacteria bacterium]|nr:hypothetical protein [Alphaproteobacteria bacterium]
MRATSSLKQASRGAIHNYLRVRFDLRRLSRYFARRKTANTLTRVDIMDQQSARRSGWRWWYLLFVIQYVAVLWPPFYNKLEPSWAGVPFFYWYQLLWVVISAVLTAIVYFATEE